ncbi:ATP-binding cassette domain-containing protein [Roseisalinus antarcticus]|uniref:Macrolide export ATP-binding/permease protein MacB n=1 Tax=Roseisalinus antarcticus TaxID=254357 RepID=A0A1Y5RIP5_9RHOB|nr:ATP-binding cassette domain-containing protein [Roseisalinus antarcticus]SLN15773.1 Macrolide export ATP-binding/permease protein MacB [Roseisalinus antarcticus]
MAAEAPIRVLGLDHFFGSGEVRKQAIFDVSLTLARGSLTVLIGPSGSGKTTLLTLMGCLRELQSGSVRLLGQELNGAGPARLVLLRRRLGFIFQAHNLHDSLTATQNVLMGLQVHGPGNAARQRAAARHMLDLLGLAARRDYLPAKLSGGQKQRVAVARALASNPEVVFADEPTAALDKEAGRTVVEMLKALGRTRGVTTVMVTHDTRILGLADRIITLEEGRIVGDTGG